MPNQVLFIQGGGAGAHDEWDNKLVASLARELGSAYEIHYPRMPDEANPTYAAWKAALEAEIAALDDGNPDRPLDRRNDLDQRARREPAGSEAVWRLSHRGTFCGCRRLAE